MAETRKSHVRRIKSADDPDVWVDVQRADLIKFENGQGPNFQRIFLKLKWADESVNDHPTRKLTIKRLTNPEDETQFVEIPVIDKMMLGRSPRTIYKKFRNTSENKTRKLSVRRVYHKDTVTDPNDDGGVDYQKIDGTEDQAQYIDTFVIEKYVIESGRGPDFIRRFIKFNTAPIKEHSVEAPEGVDPTTLVYLDPFQNIVNVQWDNPFWVVGMSNITGANYLHSLDGRDWSEPGTEVATLPRFISYGGGKWFSGSTSIFESDDGISWSALETEPDFVVYAGCFGLGVHVLGGLDKLAWSDDDGVTWHNVAVPYQAPAHSAYVTSLSFIKADPNNPAAVDRFFAGIREVDNEIEEQARLGLMTSTDGKSWSGITELFDGLGDLIINVGGVAYGNGKYVATGSVFFINEADLHRIRKWVVTSTNGTTWGSPIDTTLATGNVVGELAFGRDIAFGKGQFVIVGCDYQTPAISFPFMGVIATSSDGSSWTRVFTAGAAERHGLFCIDFGGGVFVAGGERGVFPDVSSNLMWSEDASSWTYVELEHHSNSQVLAIRKGTRTSVPEEE